MLIDRKTLVVLLQVGDLETVRKELTRYGTILETEDTENELGAFRCQTIAHYQNRFVIYCHNGTVKSISVAGKIYFANGEK